ncbi:hypothetical protein [Persicobacter diffluens]
MRVIAMLGMLFWASNCFGQVELVEGGYAIKATLKVEKGKRESPSLDIWFETAYFSNRSSQLKATSPSSPVLHITYVVKENRCYVIDDPSTCLERVVVTTSESIPLQLTSSEKKIEIGTITKAELGVNRDSYIYLEYYCVKTDGVQPFPVK